MKIVDATVIREFPYSKETVCRFFSAPALIVSWHPWIETVSIFDKCGLSFRRATLSGGETELVEKYWSDQNDEEFFYQVVEGLWSDYRYRSKVLVESTGEESCRITWEGRLMLQKPEDEKEQMEAFFSEGLDGLEVFLADL
ncbi:hypothetical protein [Pelagicoccus albus]|uniref:Activator of Hsp90 ATPase homolog 1-like protein n=1 Tax=Pelagicoccus albus TaxID=415222 RepID=A0A7X1E9C5_9BACT|nr:hypothetical protein [Pelagicoccus albus]MBC2605647.1 hypothetical protein [Pelagicoccus albus]